MFTESKSNDAGAWKLVFFGVPWVQVFLFNTNNFLGVPQQRGSWVRLSLQAFTTLRFAKGFPFYPSRNSLFNLKIKFNSGICVKD